MGNKRHQDAQRRQDEIIAKSKQMWEELGLQPRSYYVAEISWRSTNPPHRVIIATPFTSTDKVEVYNSTYENVDKAWIGAFYSFRLIIAIPEMKH